MQIDQRINAFIELGQTILLGNDNLVRNIEQSTQINAWFTKENIERALNAIAQNLNKEKLEIWLSPYKEKLEKTPVSKTIALIPAGNIPLVGFHDFLSVLISGHKVLIKSSSNDKYLLPCLGQILSSINPEFENLIEFTENKFPAFDAIIATGSNNSARYFDYYFGKYPHVIRKNRTSVAVLSGNETFEDLQALADDIFLYFGLGCRNVSKLFVPKGYSFEKLFEACSKYSSLAYHHKFKNNYDYRKAIFQMNLMEFSDLGFCIFREDADMHSPIAVINFEYYSDLSKVEDWAKRHTEELQCVVSQCPELHFSCVNFGQAQNPELWDYADGVNTLEFLASI